MREDRERVLIISPLRNEAEHLELVARSVERQSRPPDVWVVVDDGSTDRTPELLRGLSARIPFMRVCSIPRGFTEDRGDRHAVAAAQRAFNVGLGTIDLEEFTHIGNLDGDIELPDDYFALLLDEFDRDPALGIGGGVLVEQGSGGWQRVHTPMDHVRGALRLYRRECFVAVGGMREQLGWDGIDQRYARMRGYRTRAFEHLVARHLRACGTADGVLRGRVRAGETHYVVGFSFLWILLKSVKYARIRPLGVSGAAFIYGYLRAWWRSVPTVDDEEYRRVARQEERRRLMAALRFRGAQRSRA